MSPRPIDPDAIDPTLVARRHALALLNARLDTDEDLSVENASVLASSRYLVTYGYYGDSETERYATLHNTRGAAASGAAKHLTDETPAFPIALYDLDDIGPEPEAGYGDLVEHQDEQLYVVCHDWEGIEGEPQRVLTLNEDADSEGFGIPAHDYDVTLVRRSEDFEDPRAPRRYALAGWHVLVVFNTTADVAEGER